MNRFKQLTRRLLAPALAVALAVGVGYKFARPAHAATTTAAPAAAAAVLDANSVAPLLSLDQAMERVERDILQDALKSARGNRAKAARLLSTTSRVFNYKVRKYGIEWRRFRT